MTTDMEARSRKDRLLLLVLTTQGRMSVTDLGHWLNKRQQDVYSVCRRLERAEMVTFDRPKDSAVWFVTATPAGLLLGRARLGEEEL